MEETAYAKINLALHVRGREADGYHRLETIFAFGEDGDPVTVAEGEGLSLQVTGPFAADLDAGEDNLVLWAARALQGLVGTPRGAALTLDKRLPVASGIGGGSADAAATLRLLARWWNIEPPEEALLGLARKLGADVPACLASRTVRGSGRGDVLEPVDLGLEGTPLLLVNPRVALSTADVFRGWSGGDGGPLPANLLEGRNDLEAPARAICPVIGDVIEALSRLGTTRLVRMSGSGATCFALFESEGARDAAAARIRLDNPAWWTLATRLR
ncbi:MAG TPA: 4-(cytidine 5'-diphospho)-2-C-methyl-D-erythritol kinase [Allosphingosinicella sp.]|jgi:4-diphosphocytidyl-2-C-methyl-D-erythritol kinase